jgi:hypothetical protein
MKNIFITLVVLLSVNLDVFALNPDYYKLESLALTTTTPIISYKLHSDNDQNNNQEDILEYIPNSQNFIGLSLGFKNFDLSLITEARGDDKKEDVLPRSEIFDVQIIGLFNKVLWELYYQNYAKLFIFNDSDLAKDPVAYANTYSYGINLKKFTRESFNPGDSLMHLKYKKEKNWSWVHGVNFNRSKIWANSKDGLIPSQYTAKFSEVAGLSGVESTSFGYEFGITGLYAWEYFYINGMLNLGFQILNQHFEGIDEDDRYITDSLNSVMLELGVRANKSMVFGLQLRSQAHRIPIKNVEFEQQRSMVSVFFKYFL